MMCIIRDCEYKPMNGFRKCIECMRGFTPDKRGAEDE